MSITYEHLKPLLNASTIRLRDRFNNPLTEQEAKHRIVDKVQAAKHNYDMLVIVIR